MTDPAHLPGKHGRALPVMGRDGLELAPVRKRNPEGKLDEASQHPDGRWKKGKPRHPASGRKPGTRNKLDSDVKEMMDTLVAHGLASACQVYDRVVEKAPSRALAVLARFVEYRLPKLARTETSGPDGGPIVVERRTVEVRPSMAATAAKEA